MRAKRSILNLSFGLGSQLITIILGFYPPADYGQLWLRGQWFNRFYCTNY